MKSIYYLGFFDTEENRCENRNTVLSATNKMTYIIEAIEKCGCSADVISASYTLNPKKYPAKCLDIGEKSKLHLFASLPWGNKVRRVFSRRYSLDQVYRYIVDNLTGDDILIAYHSTAYMSIIAKAKRKIGFKLVLEVEEIYADVTGTEADRLKEERFFTLADSYIFPTDLLNAHINREGKPFALIHGTYKVEPDRKCNIFDVDSQTAAKKKIHCVYAGTFDPRKGGAAAAAAAEFLPADYHVHILGFGSDADTSAMKDLIADVEKRSCATVTYDGLLSGEEYIRFIQSCDIGLSTQNPDAAFNATSFPSKILSYMASGLRVVSIRIPAIEGSAVGKYMYYYDKQTPEEIAKAIMAVDINDDYDGRSIISQLDAEFQHDLAKLLGKFHDSGAVLHY